MPMISCSCSTVVNFPLVSRQARMFCAITGPTPGNVSSAASSAVLRLTRPPACPERRNSSAASLGCSGHPRRRIARPVLDLADDHRVAVGELGRQVQPGEVGTVDGAAGGGDRIGHPGAGGT